MVSIFNLKKMYGKFFNIFLLSCTFIMASTRVVPIRFEENPEEGILNVVLKM